MACLQETLRTFILLFTEFIQRAIDESLVLKKKKQFTTVWTVHPIGLVVHTDVGIWRSRFSSITTKHTMSMINFRENMCVVLRLKVLFHHNQHFRGHHKTSLYLCKYIFYLYFSTLSDQYSRPHTFTLFTAHVCSARDYNQTAYNAYIWREIKNVASSSVNNNQCKCNGVPVRDDMCWTSDPSRFSRTKYAQLANSRGHSIYLFVICSKTMKHM